MNMRRDCMNWYNRLDSVAFNTIPMLDYTRKDATLVLSLHFSLSFPFLSIAFFFFSYITHTHHIICFFTFITIIFFHPLHSFPNTFYFLLLVSFYLLSSILCLPLALSRDRFVSCLAGFPPFFFSLFFKLWMVNTFVERVCWARCHVPMNCRMCIYMGANWCRRHSIKYNT